MLISIGTQNRLKAKLDFPDSLVVTGGAGEMEVRSAPMWNLQSKEHVSCNLNYSVSGNWLSGNWLARKTLAA